MKKDSDGKKMKIAAKVFEGLIAATDLTGQMQRNHQLIELLENQSAHEVIIESIKPQKSITDIQLEKMDALDTALSQGYELRKKEEDLKKRSKDNMDSKKEIFIKKTKENKKDMTPTKKEILEKNFIENKMSNPTKKEILDKKIEKYEVNKRDILGDNNLDKKRPDKINRDHKPDKPKP